MTAAGLTTLETALLAEAAGLSVIPVKADGTKRPALSSWRDYQRRRAQPSELELWFADPSLGIGVICGAVSGSLEMLEFEGRAVDEDVWDALNDIARQSGLGGLLMRVANGWSERSPSGGVHIFYRCSAVVAGNTVLAERPATDSELAADGDQRRKILIETRGEGGFVVISPSDGNVHVTGNPWERIHGDFSRIPAISAEERESLFALARSFDQRAKPEWTPNPSDMAGGDRPGDDFNQRADWAADVLRPAGWTRTGVRGGHQHWYRAAGGRSGWTSATISPDDHYLYVFSTSAGLPTEVGLSKFRVYAFLHHDGDFKVATAALKQRGYGASKEGSRHFTVIEGALEPDEEPRTPRRRPVEFPLVALPERLAAWVEEGAAALHVPQGMLATAALAAVGSAIGASRSIEIKAGWRELPTIWAATVAHPGSGKSPAQSAATQPLQELEREANAEYGRLRQQYEQELLAHQLLPRQQRGQPPEEPEHHRCLVQDVTSEALGALLARHQRGLLQDLDELSALMRGFNQYKAKGTGSDRSRYLSMWSSQPIWVDRKSTPQPIYVGRPFLCITGGLPPALAAELREQGLDDGFTDRFLFHLALEVEARPWSEAVVSSSTQTAYFELVARLRRLEMEPDRLDLPAPRVLRKGANGHRAWTGFYDAHEEERLSPDLDVRLLGYYEKLKSYAARLALICHLVRRLDDRQLPEDVDERSVAMGWALVDHYKAHAEQVHQLFSRTGDDARGDALVTWMRRHAQNEITARQACRSAAGGIRTASEAAEVFKHLADKGWGRIAQHPNRGGQVIEFHLGLEESVS